VDGSPNTRSSSLVQDDDLSSGPAPPRLDRQAGRCGSIRARVSSGALRLGAAKDDRPAEYFRTAVRNLTFFDTAATLIPVLLLGGAIVERFRGLPDREPGGWEATLVFVLFFMLPAFAEVIAISAALGDSPDDFAIVLVTFAVTFGTFALAASLTWPWLMTMFEGRVRAVISALVLGGLVLVCTSLLVTSVDLETVRQDLAATLEEQAMGEDQSPIFNEDMLRYVDSIEDLLDARLAAGRISEDEAARERLGIAKTRKFIANGMLDSPDLPSGLDLPED
jgi:hypothetical protein